jgi:hypothetical protein
MYVAIAIEMSPRLISPATVKCTGKFSRLVQRKRGENRSKLIACFLILCGEEEKKIGPPFLS